MLTKKTVRVSLTSGRSVTVKAISKGDLWDAIRDHGYEPRDIKKYKVISIEIVDRWTKPTAWFHIA